MGRDGLDTRLIIGSLIIKHIKKLPYESLVDHISENVYMQYVCGYESMSPLGARPQPRTCYTPWGVPQLQISQISYMKEIMSNPTLGKTVSH